jgi:hypothetical protein
MPHVNDAPLRALIAPAIDGPTVIGLDRMVPSLGVPRANPLDMDVFLAVPALAGARGHSILEAQCSTDIALSRARSGAVFQVRAPFAGKREAA